METDSQLLTAVDVLPDNARDSARALTLVARSQASTDVRVAGTTVDTAHRDGVTRDQMHSGLTGFPCGQYYTANQHTQPGSKPHSIPLHLIVLRQPYHGNRVVSPLSRCYNLCTIMII